MDEGGAIPALIDFRGAADYLGAIPDGGVAQR
jgi:hypothetical protein